MLTNTEIEAIRKRAEKATGGEWEYIEGDNVVITIDREYMYSMEIAEEFMTTYDAEFIANARTDIPKLLAEIDRLNEKIEEYELQRKADEAFYEYYGGDV